MTMITAALTSLTAAAAALFALQEIEALDPNAASILNHSYLVLVSLSGSLGGGIVAIAFLRGRETRRELAMKFLGCTVAGLIFSPLIIHCFHIPIYADYIIGVSGGVALVSWRGMRRWIPSVASYIENFDIRGMVNVLLKRKRDS